MSDVYEIKIKKGFSDGSLQLSDLGHTRARKKDFIVWTIKNDIDVTSIEGIEMKAGSTNIFISPPASTDGVWTAKLKNDIPDYSEYRYSIIWNGTWGSKTFDPKISVRPTKFHLTKWSTGIILSLFMFLTLDFLRRKKSSK